MNLKSAILCAGTFLALTSLVTRPLLADEWNKKVEFQFSEAVQIPGHTLPAGKYVLQLADDHADRNIVQIFAENPNGTEKLVTTLLAVPAYRVEMPDNPVVHFEERPGGSPEAIHSVFYPGEHTG